MFVMERKKKNGIFKRLSSIWILLLITVLCIGLAATNVQQKVDYRFYDFINVSTSFFHI